jgi:hypothetical protein
MEILAGHRKVNLDQVVLFLGAMLVKKKNHVSRKNIMGVFLKVGYLVGNMCMNGSGELEMTGTEVDLHNCVFLILF